MLKYCIAPTSTLATLPKEEKKHWGILGVVSFIALVIFSVPWYPSIPRFGLDSSWILVLHHAFDTGMLFGKDLTWHYGPLGFLFGGNFFPENFTAMLLIYSAFCIAFFAGLWRIITEKAHTEVALVIPVIFIAISYDAFFIAFGQMLFCYYFFVRKSLKALTLWLLWAAVVAASLVKITYLLLAVVVLLLMDIDRIASRQLPIWIALSIAAWLGLWELLGQESHYFIPWIKGAVEITRGFKAMGLYRPWPYAVAYLACYAVFGLLMASVLFKRHGWRALIPLAGIGAMGVMCLKLGFTHSNDHHFIEAILIFIFLAFLTKDLVWSDAGKIGQGMFFCTYVIVLGLFAWQVIRGEDPSFQNVSLTPIAADGKTPISYSEAVKHAMFRDGGLLAYQEKYEAAQARMRKKIPLPELEGDMDMYSHYQVFVFANGYDYNPRPTFQSYHVYTPWLAQNNRDYITSGKSAKNVLFAITPFDDRLPSFDDGLSWLALRTHYQIMGEHDFYLHMIKRDTPLVSMEIPIAEGEYHVGEPIAVPDVGEGQTLWAQMELKPTWFGKLATLFFRDIMWEMTVVAGDETYNYNFVHEIGKSGFTLNPLILETADFKQWFEGKKVNQPDVKFIQITPRYAPDWLAEWLFSSKIEAKFSAWELVTPQ